MFYPTRTRDSVWRLLNFTNVTTDNNILFGKSFNSRASNREPATPLPVFNLTWYTPEGKNTILRQYSHYSDAIEF